MYWTEKQEDGSVTTDIRYRTKNTVLVRSQDGSFYLVASEFNRRHEGVWNSRVLAFVPQPEPVDKSGYRPHKRDTHFSDGTPVAAYQGWN